MKGKLLFLMVLALAAPFWVAAQADSVALPGKVLLRQDPGLAIQPTPQVGTLIPDHVRANPQAHAPLCRLETRLEKQSPVAPWIKLQPAPMREGLVPQRATFQLKLKRF